MFKNVQNGWLPPEHISEEHYNNIRTYPERYPKHIVGFAGIACAFGGRWFGSYARGQRQDGRWRNYVDESCRNVLNQVPGISGVDFRSGSYLDLDIPDNSLIYCDPPYLGTASYSFDFDSKQFWSWASKKVSEGHSVFVSEYSAPNSWKTVWKRKILSSINMGSGWKERTEKLFTKS